MLQARHIHTLSSQHRDPKASDMNKSRSKRAMKRTARQFAYRASDLKRRKAPLRGPKQRSWRRARLKADFTPRMHYVDPVLVLV